MLFYFQDTVYFYRMTKFPVTRDLKSCLQFNPQSSYQYWHYICISLLITIMKIECFVIIVINMKQIQTTHPLSQKKKSETDIGNGN